MEKQDDNEKDVNILKKCLVKLTEKVSPTATKSYYFNLEESSDFIIVLPFSIDYFIKEKCNDMRNKNINHEFGGFLYGFKVNNEFVVCGISEDYSEATRAQATLTINSEHVDTMKKKLQIDIIGNWHTHNIAGFSVSDIDTFVTERWRGQEVVSNGFDLSIFIVAGPQPNSSADLFYKSNEPPKLYSLLIKGQNPISNYKYMKPKIVIIDNTTFVKKYNKTPLSISS